MDAFELYNLLQYMITLIDPDPYPELLDYCAEIMNEDECTVTEDPCEIANRFFELDEPADLPSEVIDTAIELYKAAFEAGDADAMNDLGARFYDGTRGFEQDYSKAVECYTLAAKNGSRLAQENLGYCYYYGRNVPVDYEKAFHYFALGAFDGHIVSLYKIGDMYAKGYYVSKNEEEAFRIYERCLDTMTEEYAHRCAGPVYLRMGRAFLTGAGTEKNAESALICFQKAELFLYNLVRDGDEMYRKSLREAVEGQEKARKVLERGLPEKSR